MASLSWRERRLPLAWADVKHEALVEDFDGELARILNFLELAPHEGMIDVAASRQRLDRSARQAQHKSAPG